jgi:CheY-like chemotaxis protein/anti-sigma regulatory factor (Ser/Thr protein kinase)
MQILGNRPGANHLELICHLDADVPPRLIGDEAKLRQVVINLLGNALKFTKQGEIVLAVAVRERRGDDLELEVEVRDTGIGIPADRQQSIFDAFTQADGSITRKFGGTGLGLTISARLVGLMQGRIQVASKPGVGSSFKFTVRLQSAAPIEQPQPTRRPRTALVIEHATLRQMLRDTLRSWDLEALVFEDSDDLLRHLGLHPDDPAPEVLIVDAAPNSASLAKLLEAVPTTATARIVQLVKSADRLSGNDRTQDPRFVTLLKPLQPSRLRRLLLDSGTAVATDDVDRPRIVPTVAPSLRILVAEDAPINQLTVQRLLTRLGHRVTLAENGAVAVKHWRDGEFDLVLMDMQMPVMDGLEATRQIRKLEAGRDRTTPIVALTANAFDRDREECLRAGIDAHLAKPVSSAALQRIIAEISSRSRTVADAGKSTVVV